MEGGAPARQGARGGAGSGYLGMRNGWCASVETDFSREAAGILEEYVGGIFARCIVRLSLARSGVPVGNLAPEDCRRLMQEFEIGLKNYVSDPARRDECRRRLDGLLLRSVRDSAEVRRSAIAVRDESDIARARGAGRAMCMKLGFSVSVQIKVATAISELARNIVQYAGRGEIVLIPLQGERRGLEVVARDEGPGIADVDRILSGDYTSVDGMGLGLLGAKRLMDEFDIVSAPGKGTNVRVRKYRA